MSRSRARRSANPSCSHDARGSFSATSAIGHSVDAFRQPDHAHTAFVELADQPVRTDAATRLQRVILGELRVGRQRESWQRTEEIR